MLVTLFATHYENKLMIASRRWRSLVFALRKEGVAICVVTPGGEDVEYTGDCGETVLVFKSKRVKKSTDIGLKKTADKRVLHTPFPYLDVSVVNWYCAVRNSRVAFHCSRSDILISTYGPAGAMLAGLWLSRKFKRPWVLDLRDSFQLPALFTFKPLLKLNSRIEKLIVGQAVLLVTIGQVLADYLSDKYQNKFEYVYNGWLDTDALKIKQEPILKPYFLYAGSIYEHQLDALKLFLDVLLVEDNITLRIRLIRDYSGRLDAWLLENGFDSLVEVFPPVSNNELENEMSLSAGVLILEELEPNDWQKGTVTGKLFPLLVSGVSGIVISHPEVEVSQLASKANGWFCGHDKKSTKQAVLSVLECERSDSDNNKNVFKEYNYMFQAKKLLKLCRGVINEHN